MRKQWAGSMWHREKQRGKVQRPRILRRLGEAPFLTPQNTGLFGGGVRNGKKNKLRESPQQALGVKPRDRHIQKKGDRNSVFGMGKLAWVMPPVTSKEVEVIRNQVNPGTTTSGKIEMLPPGGKRKKKLDFYKQGPLYTRLKKAKKEIKKTRVSLPPCL